MRGLFVCALLLALQPVRAAEPNMGEGGCESYTWDMKRWCFLLESPPLPFTALSGPADDARFTPVDRPLRIALHPQNEVGLLAEPGRDHRAAGGYGGLTRLTVPRVSTYRISSDRRLWVDVIGPQGAVASSRFEMRTGCDKLVKSVAFRLEPDTTYWLQIAGSPAPEAMLLITLDR